MKVFILEDNPERVKCFKRWFAVEHTLYITDNVEDAKKIYEEHAPFDTFLLDHDLGGEIYVDSEEENTGYQFAKWLSKKDVLMPRMFIQSTMAYTHSLNTVGAQNIVDVLGGTEYCRHIPFTKMYGIFEKKNKAVPKPKIRRIKT